MRKVKEAHRLPHASRRHFCAQSFYEQLAALVYDTGEAVLYGSWDMREAHTPPPFHGWIQSHSDIDIAYDGPPEATAGRRLADRIRELACRSRISVSRISIRPAALLAKLPHLAAGTSTRSAAPRSLNGDSVTALLFWTHVSALEALCTVRHARQRRLNGEGYAAAKMLLVLLRNLAMSHGQAPRRYHDVVSWCGALLTTSVGQQALRAKIGALTLPAVAATELYLGPTTLRPILSTLCPRDSVHKIDLAAAICREQIVGNSPLDCSYLLSAAKELVFDDLTSQVLDYQSTKLSAAGFGVHRDS